jgi:glutamate synthase domain-containing protein 1
MYGYKCTLQTDTEVITYIIDYLHRKKGLSFNEIASVIAAPFWQIVDGMPREEKETYEFLRIMFSAQLITGPFSILVGFEGGLMALNDRLKLRSMVVGEKDTKVYFASEEAAIRIIEPDLDTVWSPKGGEPVIVQLDGSGA